MMNGDELNTLIDLPRKSTYGELRRAQFTAVKIVFFYEWVKYCEASRISQNQSWSRPKIPIQPIRRQHYIEW